MAITENNYFRTNHSTTTTTSTPQPRSGWLLGAIDQFIGPGATTAEVVLQLSAAFAVGLLCLLSYWKETSTEENVLVMSKVSSVVVLLLGVDLIGGVVTNSTSAAKRWYHRDGQG